LPAIGIGSALFLGKASIESMHVIAHINSIDTAFPHIGIDQSVRGALTLNRDHLKKVMLQCVKDASYVIQNAQARISDEIQNLATKRFIARTKFGS
jgi:hypothetical protein